MVHRIYIKIRISNLIFTIVSLLFPAICSANLHSDSLHFEIIAFKSGDSTVEISVENSTNDTEYLYSYPINYDYLQCAYYHYLIGAPKTYCISMLPIPSCLTLSETSIYEFIKIAPHSKYALKIERLSKYFHEDNNAILHIIHGTTEEYRRAKKYSLKEMKGDFNFLFEFAVFQKVNLISGESKFNGKEEFWKSFNEQEKAFKIYQIKIGKINFQDYTK